VHRLTLALRAALLTIAGLLCTVVHGGTPPAAGAIPTFNAAFGAVFPADRATELLSQCSRTFPRPEGIWTPNEKHIRELERRLAFELAKALSASASDLQVGDYYRQYGGVVVSGRRLIYVNGFHRHIVDPHQGDWTTKVVNVCDGGESFWQAAYDPDRRTFVVFQFEGGGERIIVFNGHA
jgi:hypothetical protein